LDQLCPGIGNAARIAAAISRAVCRGGGVIKRNAGRDGGAPLRDERRE
jgi:hypothetical protein